MGPSASGCGHSVVSSNSTSGRIPSLDGLRAFSILCVVAGHLAIAHSLMLELSAFGVQVFFVISGYLITSLLLNEKDHSGRIDLLAFYKRRSFRIFPAAFTYIAITALLSPATRQDLMYALTYTMGYHDSKTSVLFEHLWSLSCEEQFYLLWPLALVIGFRYRGRIAVGTIVIAAAFRLSCCLRGAEPLQRILHFYFPSVMDSIAAGCLLAIYHPEVRRRCGWMISSTLISVGLPLVAFLMAAMLWEGTLRREQIVTPRLTVFWAIIPLLIALSMFLLIERRDWILNNPVASTIGVLSYSLYLWQQPFTLAEGPPLLMRLALLVCVASASYALVEHPMLKVGARLSVPNSKRITAPGNLS